MCPKIGDKIRYTNDFIDVEGIINNTEYSRYQQENLYFLTLTKIYVKSPILEWKVGDTTFCALSRYTTVIEEEEIL